MGVYEEEKLYRGRQFPSIKSWVYLLYNVMKSKKEKYIKETMRMTHAMLTINEAKLLFSLAKHAKGDIVETGSYKGGSTLLLGKGLKIAKGGRVYAIDPHNLGSSIQRFGNEIIPKNSFPFLKENIKKAKLKSIIIPIIATSEKAEKRWSKSINLLWIDGNHTYEYTKIDFLLWEKYLSKGGVIAFHDTKDSNNRAAVYGSYILEEEGPARVIKENILNSKRFTNIKTVDSITFAEKVKDADRLELLKNRSSVYLLKIIILHKEIDRFLGNIGLFLKHNFPELYFILVRLKGRKASLIQKVKPYTLLSRPKLSKLYDIAKYLEKKRINSSFVECGVWKGGSAVVIASVAKNNENRHVWLFDSWERLPKPGKYDISYKGEPSRKGLCRCSKKQAEDLIYKKFKLKHSQVHFVKGWFRYNIKYPKNDIGKIAPLHIDCDWYKSVKFCLEELYDSVVKGGFIFIDDYGYWKGCKKAVDQFIKKINPSITLNRVDNTGVYFQKP